MTNKIRLYWPLIKSLQTGLLLATGLAGYLSSRPPFNVLHLFGLIISLFLAISGSTIMNMWYDRDIDAKMRRTHKRPNAAGILNQREILFVGMTISILGIGTALWIRPMYGLVVFSGWFFDVIVYTVTSKNQPLKTTNPYMGRIHSAVPIPKMEIVIPTKNISR